MEISSPFALFPRPSIIKYVLIPFHILYPVLPEIEKRMMKLRQILKHNTGVIIEITYNAYRYITSN